jgi:hypothetical protein
MEIVFTFASPQASCKVLNCIDVVSQGICIANAIDDEDWKGILKCAKKKTVSFLLFSRASLRSFELSRLTNI